MLAALPLRGAAIVALSEMTYPIYLYHFPLTLYLSSTIWGGSAFVRIATASVGGFSFALLLLLVFRWSKLLLGIRTAAVRSTSA